MYLYMPYFLSSAIKSRFERLKISIKNLISNSITPLMISSIHPVFLETFRNFLTIGYRSFRFFKHPK